MSSYDPNLPKEVDDPEVLLARYDAQGVADAQLRQIFMCEQSDLEEARKSEVYKQARSGRVTEQVERSFTIDEGWDELEKQALGGLQESMVAINDPKMLLGIAVQANKAGRRRGGTQPQQNARDADIHVPGAGQQGARVVRLRTRFVEHLQDPDGAQRLTERQTEVVAMDNGDLREDMTPGQVKTILRDHVGVDPDQLSIRKHSGPDAQLATMLDFSQIAEESLDD